MPVRHVNYFRTLHNMHHCCKRLNDRSTAHYWKLAKYSRGLTSEDCQRPTAGSSYQHSLRQMIRGWKRGIAFKKRKSRRPCLLLHGVPHFRCNQLLYRTPFSKRVIRNVSLPPPTHAQSHTLSLSLTHMSHSDCSYFSFSFSLIRSILRIQGWKRRLKKPQQEIPHEAVNNIPNVLLRRVLLLPCNKPSKYLKHKNLTSIDFKRNEGEKDLSSMRRGSAER